MRVDAIHLKQVLKVFCSHYRYAPVQAIAILLGIILAVTLFVSVQAINDNAKRSYAQSTEPLSARAESLIIPAVGREYLSEEVYFALRKAGISNVLPVLEGKVRDETGRRWGLQSVDLVAAINSQQLSQSRSSQSGYDSSLFSTGMPLGDFLSGEPIVLMSSAQVSSMGGLESSAFNDISVDIVRVPDEVGLGSRMLTDLSFGQTLLNASGKLSYIAIFEKDVKHVAGIIGDDGQWIMNNQAAELGTLTDSFHLNLTAMSLLAFIVGLFITYNGIKYSLIKRQKLMVQLQQVGVTPTALVYALLSELAILVAIGTILGFVLGIQLSHVLHPTVAMTLEQLYGATLLPGEWQGIWFFQALAFTSITLLVASWQHFRQAINQPLSSHTGFYQKPASMSSHQLVICALLLTGVGVAGLWQSEHHHWTMAWLGVLIVAIPLYIPYSLLFLTSLCEKRVRVGLWQYLFNELRELISPMSHAMMALLLAVTASIGMSTLVGSFESTLKSWLDQKLHADMYISAPAETISQLEQQLLRVNGVEKVYKQYSAEDTLLGLPIIITSKDKASLEATTVFKERASQFWSRFYSGDMVAISEPTAIKLGLDLNSMITIDALKQSSVKVGAIFYDYGSPNGEVMIAPKVWFENGFNQRPDSLGLSTSSNTNELKDDLSKRLGLNPNQMFDQAEIKSIALMIFAQTFSITRALNVITLMVAVVGLFTTCLMLIDARRAAIARLFALGVGRESLMALMVGQILFLVLFTLLIALPIGIFVGYVLTEVITLRAFGWSLEFILSWSNIFFIVFMTLVVSITATLLPIWRLVNRPLMVSLQSEVL